MFRRPTHAAGDSWSKWEDPITYYRRPLFPDVLFWIGCILIGVGVALMLAAPA